MEQAILHTAVHGWYDGHIQREDACRAVSSAVGASQTVRGWVEPQAN